MHEHIHGVDPVTGEPYSGSDPDLLLWIHAVEVESFLLAYRTYAGRVTADDGDRYVAEMARVAEMVELPPGARRRPRASCATTCGRCADCGDAGRVRRPAGRACSRRWTCKYRPLWAIPTTAAIAILPGYARRLYRIPWFPPAALPVRAAVFALSRVLNLVTPTPPALRGRATQRVAA